MINEYLEISKENYCIQKLECKCNKCKYEFTEYTTSNYELVCFEDKVGKKYFLPTYGKYGYLDLLERLVDGWSFNELITQRITNEFETRLKEIMPYELSLFSAVRCPICKTEDIFINNRYDMYNYPINWIKINIKNLDVVK